MPNAMVLPEPVGARPQRSRPARPSGTVMVWMSKASSRPRAWSVRTSSAGTPSAAKGGDMMGGSPGFVLRMGFGRVDGPRNTDPEDEPGVRETHTHVRRTEAATETRARNADYHSRRHDGDVTTRPIDPTPVHTVDLPATPQRDRTIPATAWIEAPD